MRILEALNALAFHRRQSFKPRKFESKRKNSINWSVAIEEKWDSEEFLRNCCKKAFLPETTWQSAQTRIFKFQAQIFHEKTPSGAIIEEK
ncbi:MAG: AMMECR1 domain-containing protein [Candidatus ainarchaeum sp.]|nr:AMMECR1 domain-containing protein [Candidatus ainarchaeum sp.]